MGTGRGFSMESQKAQMWVQMYTHFCAQRLRHLQPTCPKTSTKAAAARPQRRAELRRSRAGF